MFDPIHMSNEIRDSYVDYITTTFEMADSVYQKELLNGLEEADVIAKGPYLDIGGSYETGHTLHDLMDAGEASSLFLELEPIPEKQRELKLERPLYTHQEEAFRKAASGGNLVVTTGTGSGKTECFLIPIVNHLLREIESGSLDNCVRAIIIYPMNALANDQMKRMRALLRGYPQITYGVYNGNTEHTQKRALTEYRRMYQDEGGNPKDPAPNELISREVMQKTPPHILITNYSMLEYMMLRPKDDAVFSSAKLRFIVLDEAHIYKGATGMETSLLMRRLRARLREPNNVRFLLTSATLGNQDMDGDIIQFAEKLCGVEFRRSDIIRSKEKRPAMEALLDFPPELYEELDTSPDSVASILQRYHADFCPDGDTGEKLYSHFLHSACFDSLRRNASVPTTVSELRRSLSELHPMTQKQVTTFISVCARAERDGASLMKPRYHLFIRALEGAYATLSGTKRLFLQRKTEWREPPNGESETVFEVAVCTDCGRMAVVGKEERGFLRQYARQGNNSTEYYCLIEEQDGEALEDDDVLDGDTDHEMDDGALNFVLCPVCGAIATQADAKISPMCSHDMAKWKKVRKVKRQKNGDPKCPACGFGRFRRFYLGGEAATSVLGTELFEQLPREDVFILPTAEGDTSRRSIFAKAPKQRILRKERARQFLCFSDSRSEAAYFASYMERSYQEFLRRRGIWHIAEKYREEGRASVSVAEFVDALTRYFVSNRSFSDWERSDEGLLSAVSRSNAWVAILNEMYNARRGTSLVSMGILSFLYNRNDTAVEGFQSAFNLDSEEARSLLELLVQDAVFNGAVNAGKSYTLSPAEREYIFFAPSERKLVLLKEAGDKRGWISGWRGRKRANGNFYPNTRITRLVRALNISEDEADELLEDYWKSVFPVETEEFSLDARDFEIRIGGTENARFYRCQKCGRVTPFNVKNQCASIRCPGRLMVCNPLVENENNHFAKLYRGERAEPLFIKEHTAQLAKKQQTEYQEAFVQKKINVLSCSTTFEMGVDLGTLETVYLRDIPPSPANYVQRAGRAGRSLHSAAFVLTYAKLSSHDFTYYQNPSALITGSIKPPIFEIENEKILNRHIFAVALSSFLAEHEEVYDGDNQTVLLNEGGYELLKAYLSAKPESLRQLMLKSIPKEMHSRLGISDFTWVERLCGENGVLEIAVQDFRGTIQEMEREMKACRRRSDLEGAGRWQRSLRLFRCGKDDESGKKSLIEFLVRNNVLPKYGFPVDTVELIPDISSVGRGKSLQLARDLQIAIAEYAPGAEVVADGWMYKSRYIRRLPGKNTGATWELGYYCDKCPNCGQPNFTKDPLPSAGRECVSCHEAIPRRSWTRTLEPRLGFCAEQERRPVPMHRPERDYKTDDSYIGDPHRNLIHTLHFQVNGLELQIESTSNDSLVVVGQTYYKVCPVCGFAHEDEIPNKHKTMRGYPCVNQGGSSSEYRLSHDFKTDVAKITFHASEAADWDTMLSVLYALLEGLSREMGIERTDMKGVLFRTSVDGMILFSVVLYDAVAGGAGHVRRLVTEDGKAFQRVLAKAVSVVDSCRCDGSCYQCLRNYYNQKLHDNLDRRKASSFLKQWMGEMLRMD